MDLLLTADEYYAVDSIRGAPQDVFYMVTLAEEHGDHWKLVGEVEVFRKLHNTVVEDLNAGIHDAEAKAALDRVYRKVRAHLKQEGVLGLRIT